MATLPALAFSKDPRTGRISAPKSGPVGFGEGNNFLTVKRQRSSLIGSLRGKIDGNHPQIITKVPKNPDRPAFTRFRIRANRDNITGNERSELAVGPLFSGDQTVHIGFSFRLPRFDGITGRTAYLLQIWQPVEQPRAGVRINTSDPDSYDLVSRTGGGITRPFADGGRGWNDVVMSINNRTGITWRTRNGRVLAQSPGGFLDPGGVSQSWRPKFGAYGFGGSNANIDVRGFTIGSDLKAVTEALT
jgi:hypothetical protein